MFPRKWMRDQTPLATFALCVILAMTRGLVSAQTGEAPHYAGPDTVAPQVLPINVSIAPPQHCEVLDGVVTLTAIIRANGLAEQIQVDRSDSLRLNHFAIEFVKAQRFTAGTYQDHVAPIAVEMTLALHTCQIDAKKTRNLNDFAFVLRSHPFLMLHAAATPPTAQTTAAVTTYRVGGAISAPVPTDFVNPENLHLFSKSKDSCLISLIIDADGRPKNIRIAKSKDPDFDRSIVEAIQSWHFQPALKDGKTPVAVEGTIAANVIHYARNSFPATVFVAEPVDEVLSSEHGKLEAPVLLNGEEVAARYWPESRIPGTCVITFVVDTQGIPQNVHVVKKLDSSLDLDLIEYARHLRYKPAIKDGTTPIQFTMTLPVSYREKIILFDRSETPRALFAGSLFQILLHSSL